MDEEEKKVDAPEETEVDNKETEVEEEQLELEDPFKNVPKFDKGEGEYEDLEVDPVEVYRKGLKDGAELNKKESAQKAEPAKGEVTSGDDDKLTSLLNKVQNLEQKLSQAETNHQKLQYSKQLAQNNSQARSVQDRKSVV